MARRKPRSPGVSLRNRALGLHRWDDEAHADGGKRVLRRMVRRAERDTVRREAAEYFAR